MNRHTRGGGNGVVSLIAGFGLAAVIGLSHLAAVVFGLTPAVSGRHPGTLLVLGAAQYNGRPSPAFQVRLEAAVRAFRAGYADRVVVSGGVGTGDARSEGSVGRNYLLARGLPADCVQSETRSRNTLQNLRFSRVLVGSEAVLIVTDGVHAPRALALARAIGLESSVLGVKLRRSNLRFWRYALREAAITTAYAIVGPD